MNKQKLTALLRNLGMAWMADYVRFQIIRIMKSAKNKEFKKAHSEISLPPDYLIYESFQMNYEKYYFGGEEDARSIVDLASKHMNFTGVKILDWGCGPGRIIRHLPTILGPTNEYHGTDYNSRTIKWCRNNIKDVSFELNHIDPPLSYPSDYFNFVIGFSILTHLSEINQKRWVEELYRILAKDGILYITTFGEAFSEKMMEVEKLAYSKGNFVSRGKVKEGHRMFAAFQPPSFIRNIYLNTGFQILQHIQGKRVNARFISQDIWILKK